MGYYVKNWQDEFYTSQCHWWTLSEWFTTARLVIQSYLTDKVKKYFYYCKWISSLWCIFQLTNLKVNQKWHTTAPNIIYDCDLLSRANNNIDCCVAPNLCFIVQKACAIQQPYNNKRLNKKIYNIYKYIYIKFLQFFPPIKTTIILIYVIIYCYLFY